MDSIYAEMTPRALDKRAADIAAAVAAGQGGQGAALTAPVPGKQLVWSKLPELPNPTQQYCMTRWAGRGGHVSYKRRARKCLPLGCRVGMVRGIAPVTWAISLPPSVRYRHLSPCEKMCAPFLCTARSGDATRYSVVLNANPTDHFLQVRAAAERPRRPHRALPAAHRRALPPRHAGPGAGRVEQGNIGAWGMGAGVLWGKGAWR